MRIERYSHYSLFLFICLAYLFTISFFTKASSIQSSSFQLNHIDNNSFETAAINISEISLSTFHTVNDTIIHTTENPLNISSNPVMENLTNDLSTLTINNSINFLPSIPFNTSIPSNHQITTKESSRPLFFSFSRYKASLPKNLIAITFVNGIYHSESEWKDLADQISDIFGTEVYPFYFPSSGNWVQDASQASYVRFIRPSDHPQVLALVKHLRNVLGTLSPRGRILHLAHSGGAILTYLAAKFHLTKEEKDRIDVITFGGGRSITRKYFGGYIVNYYATNDLISLIDGRAAVLKNKKIMRNDTFLEIKDEKHNTSFVYLRALANNILLDHSMNGPTYRIALLREAKELRKRIDQILCLEAKESDRLRLTRKVLANVTGLHHFWKNPTEAIRKRLDYTSNINYFSEYLSKTYHSSYINISTPSIRLIRKEFAKRTGLRYFWNHSFPRLIDIQNINITKVIDSIHTSSSDLDMDKWMMIDD